MWRGRQQAKKGLRAVLGEPKAEASPRDVAPCRGVAMKADAEHRSIPFNRPYMTGKELFYIAQAHFDGALAGDGPFTRRAQAMLEKCPVAAKSGCC